MPEKISKKVVLMTGISLCGYTGSELHLLEMASEFYARGYRVVLAVFDYAYPLLSMAKSAGIIVINAYTDRLPQKHFDIFFAQHYAVADYLIIHREFTFDRLVVSSLGYLEPMETPPLYAEDAELILFVSEKTRRLHMAHLKNVNADNVFVFPNYATEGYFASYRPKKAYNVRNIAVISNHICSEVHDFLHIARANDCCVDTFGIETGAVYVTPEMLSGYDAVITIGRTAQYCMAQGIPLYCYDHFGGPGFITKENFKINKETNFSGRSVSDRKTGREIFDDITKKGAVKKEDIAYLAQAAHKFFDLTRLFDDFMERLYERPARKRRLTDFFEGRYERYTEAMARQLRRPRYCKAQVCVFFDYGNGFVEEGMQCFLAVCDMQISLEITIPKEAAAVRFDPDDFCCKCKIFSVTGEDENGKYPLLAKPLKMHDTQDGWDYMFDTDPQYLISYETKPVRIKIVFVIKSNAMHEMVPLIQRKVLDYQEEAVNLIYSGQKKEKTIGRQRKCIEEQKKVLEEERKAIDGLNRIIDGQNKIIEEQQKAITEQRKAIEWLQLPFYKKVLNKHKNFEKPKNDG